jgi:hypothetical protein
VSAPSSPTSIADVTDPGLAAGPLAMLLRHGRDLLLEEYGSEVLPSAPAARPFHLALLAERAPPLLVLTPRTSDAQAVATGSGLPRRGPRRVVPAVGDPAARAAVPAAGDSRSATGGARPAGPPRCARPTAARRRRPGPRRPAADGPRARRARPAHPRPAGWTSDSTGWSRCSPSSATPGWDRSSPAGSSPCGAGSSTCSRPPATTRSGSSSGATTSSRCGPSGSATSARSTRWTRSWSTPPGSW